MAALTFKMKSLLMALCLATTYSAVLAAPSSTLDHHHHHKQLARAIEEQANAKDVDDQVEKRLALGSLLGPVEPIVKMLPIPLKREDEEARAEKRLALGSLLAPVEPIVKMLPIPLKREEEEEVQSSKRLALGSLLGPVKPLLSMLPIPVKRDSEEQEVEAEKRLAIGSLLGPVKPLLSMLPIPVKRDEDVEVALARALHETLPAPLQELLSKLPAKRLVGGLTGGGNPTPSAITEPAAESPTVVGGELPGTKPLIDLDLLEKLPLNILSTPAGDSPLKRLVGGLSPSAVGGNGIEDETEGVKPLIDADLLAKLPLSILSAPGSGPLKRFEGDNTLINALIGYMTKLNVLTDAGSESPLGKRLVGGAEGLDSLPLIDILLGDKANVNALTAPTGIEDPIPLTNTGPPEKKRLVGGAEGLDSLPLIDALIGDKAIVNALKAGGGDAIPLEKRGFIRKRVSGDADAPLVNILAAFMDKINVLSAPATRAVHRTKKGDAPIAIEAMLSFIMDAHDFHEQMIKATHTQRKRLVGDLLASLPLVGGITGGGAPQGVAPTTTTPETTETTPTQYQDSNGDEDVDSIDQDTPESIDGDEDTDSVDGDEDTDSVDGDEDLDNVDGDEDLDTIEGDNDEDLDSLDDEKSTESVNGGETPQGTNPGDDEKFVLDSEDQPDSISKRSKWSKMSGWNFFWSKHNKGHFDRSKMTWYAGGQMANPYCGGKTPTSNDYVVAVAPQLIKSQCNQKVRISRGDKVLYAKVVDECPPCKGMTTSSTGGRTHIDASQAVFKYFDNLEIGELHDITYTFVHPDLAKFIHPGPLSYKTWGKKLSFIFSKYGGGRHKRSEEEI